MPPVRSFCQRDPFASMGRRLLAEAARAAHAAEATLWLISEDHLHLEGTLNHGKTPHLLESLRVPVTASVVGMVASTGVAASIGPDDYHNPVATAAGAADTRAMIAVPVYVKGELAGVVSAINPADGGLFSAQDMEQLSFRAYLIGLVLADTHGI
jgi:putative methionine-R-sulfoxide reductase with GAF domain